MASSKSKIQYDDTDIPKMIELAQHALKADVAHDPIFQRGDALACLNKNVTDDARDALIQRHSGALSIRSLRSGIGGVAHYMLWRLSLAADFYVVVDGEAVKQKVPRAVVDQLLAAHTAWRMPWLEGIVTTPTIELDTGAILAKPGYDIMTGLWFDDSNLPKLPPFADNPTQDDARKALAVLLDLLKEFCFETELDRAGALAMILTAMIRRVLPTAPAFLLDAPGQSNGKTLLASLPGLIATGLEPGETSWADDSAEQRKALGAIIMGGDLIIKFDNVVRPIGGSDICKLVTARGNYKDRILGVSTMMDIRPNVVLIFTGNNIRVKDDLASRVVRVRLDAKMEFPSHRKFERPNLAAWTLEHRSELIHAALTIIRAHVLAGLPGKHMTSGRFDEWSTYVAAALCWLGLPDATESQSSVIEDDPVRNAQLQVFEAWLDEFGGDNLVTAHEIAATHVKGAGYKETYGPTYQALVALAEETSDKFAQGPASVSARLKKFDGVIVEGMKLETVAAQYEGKGKRWRLVGHIGPEMREPEEPLPDDDVIYPYTAEQEAEFRKKRAAWRKAGGKTPHEDQGAVEPMEPGTAATDAPPRPAQRAQPAAKPSSLRAELEKQLAAKRAREKAS